MSDVNPEDTNKEAEEGPASPDVDELGAAEVSETDQLSAEEQMSLYEESLKNDDWGHQPC